MKVSLFYLPSIGSRAEIERGKAGLRGDLYQRMLAELAALPEIEAVAAMPIAPFANGSMVSSWSENGRQLTTEIAGATPAVQTIVDAGEIPVEPGEEVVLLGGRGDQAVSVERWAELAGIISYEVLCGLGQRLPRVYYR